MRLLSKVCRTIRVCIAHTGLWSQWIVIHWWWLRHPHIHASLVCLQLHEFLIKNLVDLLLNNLEIELLISWWLRPIQLLLIVYVLSQLTVIQLRLHRFLLCEGVLGDHAAAGRLGCHIHLGLIEISVSHLLWCILSVILLIQILLWHVQALLLFPHLLDFCALFWLQFLFLKGRDLLWWRVIWPWRLTLWRHLPVCLLGQSLAHRRLITDRLHVLHVGVLALNLL